jgi:glutamine---fructose-6-phosphate transaminase (isomerizing)
MCSIVAYMGKKAAAPILINSLKIMEDYGCDSAGIGTTSNGEIFICKRRGKVTGVSSALLLNNLPGTTGLGHTRLSTHGVISNLNAHPHTDCTSTIAVVHNGIIENHKDLKEELGRLGHSFKSSTDTEVIPHLIEKFYLNDDKELKESIMQTCKKLSGSFAFVAMFSDNILCGARHEDPPLVGREPLIFAFDDNNDYFITDHYDGLSSYAGKSISLDNNDIIIIKQSELNLINFDGIPVRRFIEYVENETPIIEKGNYPHFMLKEINEQTESVIEAMDQNYDKLKKFCDILSNSESIYITGSGSSYHSALIAKHLLAKYARIKSDVIPSSDFQTIANIIDNKSVLIALSQSGYTPDVLKAFEMAKDSGAKLLSIVNVTTSPLAARSDCFLEMKCGQEKGKTATKSFSAQVSVIYRVIDKLCPNFLGASYSANNIQTAMRKSLSLAKEIMEIAHSIKDIKDIYIIGKSVHYPIALEGAMKLKEHAYVHAEGIEAGEMKYGTIAAIDDLSAIIAINPIDPTFDDIKSTVNEIKARDGSVIGISDKRNENYDHFIEIPHMDNDILYPLIEVIPFQLLAYNLALTNNMDPDNPRNLRKFMTR